MDVYRWPNPDGTDTMTLTTVGMAEKSAATALQKTRESRARGVELVMLCNPEDLTALAQVMIDLADYPLPDAILPALVARPAFGSLRSFPIHHCATCSSPSRRLMPIKPLTKTRAVVSTFFWVIPISDGSNT